jgi:Ca2+-binding RTX toxin-like protein
MYLKGLYFGNTPSDLTTAETALGGAVDMVALQTGRATWADWLGSIKWEVGLMSGVTSDHAARWSIPLFANGGTLADAASHKYDSYYVEAAKALVAAYGTQNDIVVRTGEEFNGNWFPWAAAGKEADFAQAYRNFVDAFRSVAPNFKFEWNVANGQTGTDVAKAYPGDNYVDYIGTDFYWDSTQSWSTKDPVSAFNYYKNTSYGLQWLEDFAAAHGKQSAYSEWGVNSPDASAYLQLVKQWFDSHNPAYEIYWDSNADFKGLITDGSYGAASSTFLQLFGGQAHTVVSDASPGQTLDHSSSAEGYFLQGANGDDTMSVGSGSSYLLGGGGSDRLVAGDGNNHIYGNAPTVTQGTTDGADTITAGAGSNYINGNAGDDIITVGRDGSLGNNRVQGGQGNDQISLTGAGANSVNGNLGNDVVDAHAATGNNLLRGGQGDDRLIAGHGHDLLSGDRGADTLVAGTGVDHITVMTGGDDADLFDFSAAGAASIASFGGGHYYQEVTDFAEGIDHIALPFSVDTMLHVADASSVDAASAAVQQFLANHGATPAVAAVQVGSDTYLFFEQASSGAVDGVIKLDGVAAAHLSTDDFAPVG